MKETQVFMAVRSGAAQRCGEGVGRWRGASSLTRNAGGSLADGASMEAR